MPGQLTKPKYKLPTMDEVRRIKPNGFNVVSTFAGAGGSSLGYRMAGFKVLWVNEFVAAARDTYRVNAEDYTIINSTDIRELSPATILSETKKEQGEIDLLDGSPPCASFSMNGNRDDDWGKFKNYSDKGQRTDDLFFEFIRIVNEVRPKTFVAENVSGLIAGRAKGYFLEILSAMKAMGYKVEARLLNASWLGVPQNRRRLIFIGVRSDLEIEPVFPKPLTYRYSVGEALEDPTGMLAPEPETCMAGYAIEGEARKLKQGEKSEKYFNLARAEDYLPCRTICASWGTGGVASVFHPTEFRKFSISEIKRICSFPSNFILTGTYKQQWERMGRAVPPLMMKAVAETIRDKVLQRIKNGDS